MTMLRRKFLNSNDIRSSESVTPVVLYWGKKKIKEKTNMTEVMTVVQFAA